MALTEREEEEETKRAGDNYFRDNFGVINPNSSVLIIQRERQRRRETRERERVRNIHQSIYCN